MMREIPVKHFYTTPLAIFSLAIVMVWCLADFAERFMPGESSGRISSGRLSSLETEIFSIEPPHGNGVLAQYRSYLQQDTTSNQQIVELGMSAEEQSKQAGDLATMYIGDRKLELKAVVSDAKQQTSPLVVLILVSNVKTGDSEIERFSDRADVYGYQLRVLRNTQVELVRRKPSDGPAATEQVIRLTMFETSE